jgi:hypothetical protein
MVDRHVEADDPAVAVADEKGYSDGSVNFTLYPWVEVFIGEDELSGFSLGNIDADVAFELGVIAHMYEPISARELHVLLKRLAGAITKVLLEPGALGQQEKITRIRRRWRLDPGQDLVDDVVSVATLFFRVESGLLLR